MRMIKKYDNVRIHLLCIHKRISCVYTRDLLCMHNTLVHALGQGPQGPGTQRGSWAGPRPWTAASFCVYTRDFLCMNIMIKVMIKVMPKKGAWAGPRPGPRPFWALAPGFPGPEHAQECCACTRDLLCIHKRFFCADTLI